MKKSFFAMLLVAGALGVLTGHACGTSSDDPVVDSGTNPQTDGGAGGLCSRCTALQKCCDVGGVMACVNSGGDRNNCGMCGNVCDSTKSDGCNSAQCTCALSPQCTGNRTCCGTGSNPGCKDLTMDAQHCGRCGMVCPTNQVCSGSTCLCGGATPRACTASEMCCGGTSPGCVNVMTDANNCGGCGVKCPMVDGRQLMCEGGMCKCGAGGNMCPTMATIGTPVLACCGNQCVDLCASMTNCGGCGNDCSVGGGGLPVCFGGACFGGGGSYDAGVPTGCTILPPIP